MLIIAIKYFTKLVFTTIVVVVKNIKFWKTGNTMDFPFGGFYGTFYKST